MLTRNQIILSAVALIVLILSVLLIWQGLNPSRRLTNVVQVEKTISKTEVLGEQSTNSASEKLYKVTRVIDGDTIEIDYQGTPKKLRYIGIDTPETVDPRRPVQCFGKEASKENKRIVEGKLVSIEKDVTEIDKFDRLLGYIYLKLDDASTLFVNDYLVRQGFAFSYPYPPDIKHQERFNQAQTEARENNRGLWDACKT